MAKYDYFVAGRWRNYKNIQPIVKRIREADKTVYCFIENEYDGDGVKNVREPDNIEELMKENEALNVWQNNPTFRKIFDSDMTALKESDNFVAVFPFGFSAHVELGTAYGLGKKCYAIGRPEKSETVYFTLDKIFPNVDEFVEAVA